MNDNNSHNRGVYLDRMRQKMADPQLIGPVIGPVRRTTPAEPGRTRGRRRALPEDLLREASRRLGVASLLGAVLWTLLTILSHVPAGGHARPWFRIPDAISGGSVVVSLALFFYSRKPGRDPRSVLDLGLGFVVLTAFAIGQMFHGELMPPTHAVTPMISWIGVVVLTFSAILPSTPGKTLLAGLIAASMNPLGMLIARARGNWEF